MAKKVQAVVKIQLPAGSGNTCTAGGPALGQHGVTSGSFVQAFDEKTRASGRADHPGSDHDLP